jgi:hypothetical protein
MKRREFIALFGSAVAGWPLAARAQQAGVPVLGYLNLGPPETSAASVAAFRKGLSRYPLWPSPSKALALELWPSPWKALALETVPTANVRAC